MAADSQCVCEDLDEMTAGISKHNSDHFQVMSLLCAVLVVMIHSGVAPVAGSWQSMILACIRGVERIAVPFFFMASGYFLAGHIGEQDWYKHAVGKRVFSLVVPFFIWFFALRIYGMSFYWMGSILGMDVCVDKMTVTWNEFFYLSGFNPFKRVDIVWYLRNVFFLVVLSPAYVMLRRVGRGVVLLALYALYVLHEANVASGSGWWMCFENFFSWRGAFFFLLGVTLRQSGRALDVKPACGTVVGVIGSILVLVRPVNCFQLISWWMEGASVLMIMTFFWSVTTNVSLPKSMEGLSMPIYLIHLFVLIGIEKVFRVLGLKIWLQTSLLAFGLKVAIAIVASVFLAKLLRKYFPTGARVMFGGR